MASFRSAGAAPCRTVAALVVCALNAAAAAAPSDLRSLPPLSIDPDGVTVSGVSAGGFMALQIAVAHSSLVRGVGVAADFAMARRLLVPADR
jgi:acetyl esterase/lipase